MSVVIQSLAEISHRAKNIFIQELGVIDAMRFLNQFQVGSGDFTVERTQLFHDEKVTDIIGSIKARRLKHTD